MRYFLNGRPFRHVPTSGLHFLLLGQGIMLASNTVRQCRQDWPIDPLGWLLWGLAVAALGLLALVVQAAAREYAWRPDKPKRFWRVPDLLTTGSGKQEVPGEKRRLHRVAPEGPQPPVTG